VLRDPHLVYADFGSLVVQIAVSMDHLGLRQELVEDFIVEVLSAPIPLACLVHSKKTARAK
jgi:hypothetical protein